MSEPTRLNVELKAKRDDLAADRRVALALGAVPHAVERQTDTYFHGGKGRLKLREIDGGAATLIWYAREDRSAARRCDYHLVPAPDPVLLKSALTAALGVRGVVRKQREILLWDNVRIHLDEVAELGRFLEFEAVLTDGRVAAGEAQVAQLREAFKIAAADIVGGSYADLLGL